MRWPQPLSPLEAGVALCLNVVREPESTSAQQGALWPVGANPAQRLLMRARVSAGGSRLPPSHTDLVESSFPPPWRRLEPHNDPALACCHVQTLLKTPAAHHFQNEGHALAARRVAYLLHAVRIILQEGHVRAQIAGEL